ncbi:MAG: LicD family protein [Lachnospiraceae bacterium]|nr:LicD family protein [Lachnospiraceae bacterium]
MDEKLRQLQLSETRLLEQIIEYFDQHDIRYFAMAGTLLGTVRHEGFIPWDDDIDIGVPREDYERFLEIAAGEDCPFVSCEYRLGNNPYGYPLKIKDKHVSLKRKVGENIVVEPAWVTVFPLDGMPANALARTFHKWNLLMKRYRFYYVRSFHLFEKNQKSLSPLKRFAANLALKFNSEAKREQKMDKSYKAVDRALKKYPYKDSRYLVTLFGGYKFKEMFDKVHYQDGVMAKFEDISIRIPVDSDFVLRQLYGDYMTPPKEENRSGGHGLIDVIVNE